MQIYPPGFVKDLRHRIAEVIATYSANDVPAVCRRYGMADGTREEAFSGKYKYATHRLFDQPNEVVIEIARKVAQEEGAAELLRLLSTLEEKRVGSSKADVQGPRRVYYAERTGKSPSGGRLNLAALKSVYRSEYEAWSERGYLQEHFGFWCVDEDHVRGSLGADIDAKMLLSLGKSGLWPVPHRIHDYTEEDLFSVIEFVFDHISKPLTGRMHQHGGCGMHWETFDGPAGRAEYRANVNILLGRYESGYELSPAGEVMELGPAGTASLLATELPAVESDVQARVDSAIAKFRRRHSTSAERRDAVRDLADVLEYLRPQVKDVLTRKDEADLFNIANQFGIRHHNPTQKTDYDTAIWLSWMFYFYLATIHACTRMIAKREGAQA